MVGCRPKTSMRNTDRDVSTLIAGGRRERALDLLEVQGETVDVSVEGGVGVGVAAPTVALRWLGVRHGLCTGGSRRRDHQAHDDGHDCRMAFQVFRNVI